jgi:hypothetical protein
MRNNFPLNIGNSPVRREPSLACASSYLELLPVVSSRVACVSCVFWSRSALLGYVCLATTTARGDHRWLRLLFICCYSCPAHDSHVPPCPFCRLHWHIVFSNQSESPSTVPTLHQHSAEFLLRPLSGYQQIKTSHPFGVCYAIYMLLLSGHSSN